MNALSRHARPVWCRKELGQVLLHGPGSEDTASYTIPYVTSWASSVPGRTPVEVVQATAERVRTTAVSILDRLETRQVGSGGPPGLDRTAQATQLESVTPVASVRTVPTVVGL